MFTKGSGHSQDLLQDRLEKEKLMSRTMHRSPWDGSRSTKNVSLGNLHRTLGPSGFLPKRHSINQDYIYQDYEDEHPTVVIDQPVEGPSEPTKLLDNSVFRHKVTRIQTNSGNMGVVPLRQSSEKKLLDPSAYRCSPILGYYQPVYSLVQKRYPTYSIS